MLVARPDDHVALRQAGGATDAEAESALETALCAVLDRDQEEQA